MPIFSSFADSISFELNSFEQAKQGVELITFYLLLLKQRKVK